MSKFPSPLKTVGIVGGEERLLQLLQLAGRERGPVAALFATYFSALLRTRRGTTLAIAVTATAALGRTQLEFVLFSWRVAGSQALAKRGWAMASDWGQMRG